MAKSKRTGSGGRAYLTKRRTANAARSGFRQAAQETIQVMGYSIEAQGGWLVRKSPDGTIVKIEKLAKTQKKPKINLD